MSIADGDFLRRWSRVINGLMKLFGSLGIDAEELNGLKECRKISEFKEYLTKILNDVDARGLIGDRDSFAKNLNRVLDTVSLKAVFIKDRWIVFYKGRGTRRGLGRTARIAVSILSGGVVGFFYLGLLIFFMEVYDFPGFVKYCIWAAFAYNTFMTINYFIGLKRWSGGEYGVKAYIVNTVYVTALNLSLAMVFHFLNRRSPYYLMYALIYLGIALALYIRRHEEYYIPVPIFIPIE